MAAIYFVFMIGGALSYRVPPTGWKPEGWTAPAKKASNAMITHRHVHVSVAWKTPQFALVWLVLCLNVSAGYRHPGHGLAAAAGSVRWQATGY